MVNYNLNSAGSYGSQNLTKILSSQYNELVRKNPEISLTDDKVQKIFQEIRDNLNLNTSNFEFKDVKKAINSDSKLNKTSNVFLRSLNIAVFKSDEQKAIEVIERLEELTKSIKSKSNELYECIDRKPARNGGYIYEFILREEYRDIEIIDNKIEKNNLNDEKKEILSQRQKKAQELIDNEFPAVFPLGSNILEKLPKGDQSSNNSKQFKVMKFLGYKYEIRDNKLHIFLPDKDALTNSYNKIQQSDSNRYPKISIADSKGIATDEDFIKATLKHDTLLSSGAEFIHDHIYHVHTVICNITNDSKQAKEYIEERTRIRGIISNNKKLIEKHKDSLTPREFEIAMCILGSVADGFNARPKWIALSLSDHNKDMTSFQRTLENPLHHKSWGNFFQKKFGDDLSLTEGIYQKLFPKVGA